MRKLRKYPESDQKILKHKTYSIKPNTLFQVYAFTWFKLSYNWSQDRWSVWNSLVKKNLFFLWLSLWIMKIYIVLSEIQSINLDDQLSSDLYKFNK